jgi:hypothetical protein
MPDDFVGPPQSYPEFDSWDEKKHKSAERAIEILDGVKSFKSAGGVGVGHKYKPHYVDLMRRGGLTPDEASQIARYKMWRGGKNTPKERVPEETTEQIDARGAQFRDAPPEKRAEMFNEAKAHADDSYTRFYDDLVGPGKQAKNEPKKKDGGA